MKYQTQRLAYPYFIAAMGLFVAQVSGGLIAGLIYVFPNFLSEILPFNIIRMIHTNTLIVWLLMGFFGATYYLLPEETESEIHNPKIAWIQFWLFLVGAGATVVGYLFGIHEGREFLEQPLWFKIDIVIVALLFMYNVSMTLYKGKRTAISIILIMGLWGLTVFFLFAFYNPANLSLDKMYWWYVIHLWVEGVWELILAAILGFLLIKMTGVDREIIEKWLYIIVGLALFSGLLGTGHHYYWIGTPGYWQWLGSIFSALEVFPFLAMVIFAFYVVKKSTRNHPNKAALLWVLGCTVLSFFGAGVWGFMHTLAPVNYYSHGTQITASHGHLAFYGAYVMINLAIITYAMPHLRGQQPYNQNLNMWSFWITSAGMCFMTFTLTAAGVLQTHLERVLGMDFMEVQEQIALFFWMRLGSGVIVVCGVLLFVYATFSKGEDQQATTG